MTQSPDNAAQVEYVLVPKKPTVEMVNAGLMVDKEAWQLGNDYYNRTGSTAALVHNICRTEDGYKAMLAAAPPTPDQTALIAKLREALEFYRDNWIGKDIFRRPTGELLVDCGQIADDTLTECFIDSQAKTNGGMG